jgi:hypothetical protein
MDDSLVRHHRFRFSIYLLQPETRAFIEHQRFLRRAFDSDNDLWCSLVYQNGHLRSER